MQKVSVSLQQIRLEEDERREEEWLQAVLKSSPPGTSLKWWRDKSSGKIVLQIRRSMKIGWTETHSDGVLNASWTGTLIAKVTLNSQEEKPESSVAARILDAVWDLTLLRTTSIDTAIEDYNLLLTDRDKVIDAHHPTRCKGLLQITTCPDCEQFFGDEKFGMDIQNKITLMKMIYSD